MEPMRWSLVVFMALKAPNDGQMKREHFCVFLKQTILKSDFPQLAQFSGLSPANLSCYNHE